MSDTSPPVQPPPMSTSKRALESLAALLHSGASYRTGTIPLPATGSSIFFSSPTGTGVLRLPAATEADLELLTQACAPASFGLNNQDVIDESYRKAWKLDTQHFASQFELPYPLCRSLSTLMLGPAERYSELSFELYKLNVYGPGSFFKPHVDTPRSETMIGSLVVVFPTKHEGGGLTLRNGSSSWTLESSSIVSTNPSAPLAAYAAFYSDVEHEVLPVTSGYRLTLTYNLYRVPKSQESVPTPPTSNTDVAIDNVVDLVNTVLKDPSFLPKGGYLGLHLTHKCPTQVLKDCWAQTYAEPLVDGLKGVDALVYHAIHDVLKLECTPMILTVVEGKYDYDAHRQLDDVSTLSQSTSVIDENDIEEDIDDRLGGTPVFPARSLSDVPKENGSRPIVWVGRAHADNERQEPYVRYGNEATMGYAYQEVCLVVSMLERGFEKDS